MSARRVVIYALVDDAGQIQYIGQTRRLELRRREHRRQRPALTMIVVTVTDEGQADDVERGWIERCRAMGCPLLNSKGYRPGNRGGTEDSVEASYVAVRLTREERERLAGIARRENRKLAQQIRQFIYEGFERREREHGGERGGHDLRAVG